MNIRKRIFIPMITLAFVCCITVFITSIALFDRELNSAMMNKLDISLNFAEYEISDLKQQAQLAAFTMANDQALIDALVSNDRAKIAQTANTLLTITRIDYCTILDTEGKVLTRTLDPGMYGDSLAHLPHVKMAMEGKISSFLTSGNIIRLGAYSGAPIYDDDMNFVGIVSLGFRLDSQDFVYGLKEVTGCEISIFLGNERVSSTVMDEDQLYVMGETIDDDIGNRVLAGESFTRRGQLFGKEALIHYAPLFGANNEPIGMMGIGFYAEEDIAKVYRFISIGIVVTLLVLGICLLIARYLSGIIERRLGKMVEDIKERDILLQTVNKVAMLLLAAKDSGTIDSSIKEGMEQISRIINIDRMIIWRSVMADDVPQYHLDYSWSSEEANHKRALPQVLENLEEYNWDEKFFLNECITGTISKVSHNEQLFFDAYDIKSIIMIPLFLDDVYWGLFYVDNCTWEKEFTKEEVNILRAISLMMANKLYRHSVRMQMREASERTSLMLNTSPLCTQIWSRDLSIIDCNDAALSLFGFKEKSEYLSNFIGKCSPLHQPDGHRSDEAAVRFINQAFEKGYCRFEWMHKMPYNDTLLPAEVTLVKTRYGDEDVVIGYTRDLREYKRMVQAAEAAQFTTSAMFESNPSANILFDSDFKVIDCNPATLSFLGLKTKTELILGFTDIMTRSIPGVQPDGRASIPLIDRLSDAARDGFAKFETELIINGSPRFMDVEFKKIPYESSYAIVAYIFDMTETHEHERMLSEINDANLFQLLMLNVAVNAAKIALWDMEVVAANPINPANTIIWTEEFRRLLGFESESDFPNVLSSWSDQLHPDDKERTLNAFANHMLDETGKTPFDVEYRMLKSNNEYSYFRTTGETLRDESGKALRIAGAMMDITETKNTLLELEKRRLEAESANRTKSAFLANMSHEIRTPMNSIIGFSELALDEELPVTAKEYLNNIGNSAKWLLHIINDILDLSKIESGKITLEKIPFDLPDIFSHCQSIIIPKAIEKGIMLYCYAEPSIGKKLLGDPVRLRQVIMNILSNAVKFTNIGTVKLLASVIHSDDEKVTIYFEMKDSGIGMTPEQIKNIYEPFMQADDSITRRFGGTGLGLAITKNIIELMGGKLHAESTVGVGSKFSFELTFDIVDDDSIFTPKDIIVNEFEKPNFDGEVLVCEDNSLNQQVLRDHLRRVGLKAVIAGNGKEGVDIVSERIKSGNKPFDLIFMDIHMPVMDGLEAASKMTELGVKTPIIAVTANIMSNDLEHYKKSGMSDTLGKPFTSHELWRCLLTYIPVVSYSVIDRQRQSAQEEMYHTQLCLNFVKDNRNTFEKIKRAVEDGDIKTAHRTAHSLKSNAGQIGKNQLQAVAAVTESMLVNNENRLVKEQLDILETELNSVLNEFAPLLAEFDSRTSEKITDSDKIREIFDRLEPLLKKNSPDCGDFLNDIYKIPGAEELADKIENFQFKQALEELKKIRVPD